MREPTRPVKDPALGCQLTFAVSLVIWLCVVDLIRRWLGW